MYYYTYLRKYIENTDIRASIHSIVVFIYLFTVLETIAKLRKATVSFVTWIVALYISRYACSAPTGRNFMKLYVWVFFENLSTKFKCNSNLTRITGTLREDRYTCMITSRSVLLRMRNFSDKSCSEKNPHFMINNPLTKILPLMG